MKSTFILNDSISRNFSDFQKCVEKTQKMTKPPTARKGGTRKKAAQKPVKGTTVTKGAQVPAEVDPPAAVETEIDPTTLHPVLEDVHVAIIPTIPTRKTVDIGNHHRVDPLAVSVFFKVWHAFPNGGHAPFSDFSYLNFPPKIGLVLLLNFPPSKLGIRVKTYEN